MDMATQAGAPPGPDAGAPALPHADEGPGSALWGDPLPGQSPSPDPVLAHDPPPADAPGEEDRDTGLIGDTGEDGDPNEDEDEDDEDDEDEGEGGSPLGELAGPPFPRQFERDPRHEAIIDEVAVRMGTRGNLVRYGSRSQLAADARHGVYWVLRQEGLLPAQIARAMGMDHSSVLHGLERFNARPEWQALLRGVIFATQRCSPGVTLRRWLRQGMPAASQEHHRAVVAYATCTLLGWEQHPHPLCISGLYLVVHTPAYYTALKEALEACDSDNHLSRLPLHARAMNYRVEFPARPGAGVPKAARVV